MAEPTEWRRTVKRYGVALALSGAALFLRFALDPWLGGHAPYVTYMVAVSVTVWLAGFGPAIVTAVIGVPAALVFVIPTAEPWPAKIIGTLIYASGMVTIAFLGGRMRAARDAARRAEALRRATIDLLPQKIALLDRRGIVMDVNARWPELRPGKDFLDVARRAAATGEAPAVEALRGLEAVLARTTEGVAIEYPCGTPAERDWFLMQAASPPPDVGGAIITHVDITSVKRAEENLRRSEERLAFVTDRAQVGYWDWDIVSDELHWSASCRRLFGIPDDKVMSYARFLAAVHPADRERTDQAVKACLQGGGTHDYEIEMRAQWPNGNVRWIHAKGGAAFESGEAVRMAGIALDITALRQAQTEVWRLAQFAAENPNPVLRLATGWSLLYANAPGQEMLAALGWAQDEPVPAPLRAAVAEVRRAVKPVEVEIAVPHGRTFAFSALQPPGEDYINLYGRDITRRKVIEDRLRESEAKYRTLFESLDEGFSIVEVIFDAAGKAVDYQFIELNPSFVRQTGLANAKGQRMRALVPEHEEHWFETYGRVALTGEPVRFQSEAAQLGRWYDVYAFRLGPADWRQVAILFNDITQRKEAEELQRQSAEHAEAELRREALHDRLTGLPNRVLLMEDLETALHRAHRRSSYHFAVLFMDLDGFKAINDRYGHLAGDRLLIDLGARLRQSVRECDTVARYAGDEFVVMVDDMVSGRDATSAADRILAALREPFDVVGQPITVRVSIGIAYHIAETRSGAELIHHADAAMYRAKAMGGGQYVEYDAATRRAASEREDLEGDLRNAVDRQQFALWYQPVVAVASGRGVSAEALLRWPRTGDGVAAPTEFLATIDEIGLEAAMTRWVLREACRQSRAWAAGADAGVRISVNVPLSLLSAPGTVDDVVAALGDAGDGPCRLGVEISEDLNGVWNDAAIATMRRLSKLGVRLAIDGFGAGQLPLGVLRQMPVTELKLDAMFVAGIGTDPEAATVIKGLVALADSLGMETVAKGVETAGQLTALRDAGCRYAQGFLFSRPLPPAEAQSYLAGAA